MNKYLATIELTDEQKEEFALSQGYREELGDMDEFIKERMHAIVIREMLVPTNDKIDASARLAADEQKSLAKQQAEGQVTIEKQ